MSAKLTAPRRCEFERPRKNEPKRVGASGSLAQVTIQSQSMAPPLLPNEPNQVRSRGGQLFLLQPIQSLGPVRSRLALVPPVTLSPVGGDS